MCEYMLLLPFASFLSFFAMYYCFFFFSRDNLSANCVAFSAAVTGSFAPCQVHLPQGPLCGWSVLATSYNIFRAHYLLYISRTRVSVLLSSSSLLVSRELMVMTMHLTCYLKSVVQFGRRLHCPKHCVLVFLFVVVLRSAIERLRVARSKQKQVFRDGLLDMYMNELDSGAYDHVRYVLRMLPLHRKPLPQSAWRLLMAFGERDPAFCNFIIPHFAKSGRVFLCISAR